MSRRLHALRALLLTVVITLCSAAEASFQAMSGAYGPKATVHVARPTLRWEIWPADGVARPATVDLQMNGQAVPATYSPEARAVSYTPTAPLPHGAYQIACVVTFQGGHRFAKKWTTTVSAIAKLHLPHASSEQEQALRWANAMRATLGLEPAVSNDIMNHTALKHSEYLGANHASGHVATPGKPGFFGVNHTDRLAHFGYGGGAWEDVATGMKDVGTAMTELFDAPYHRLPFMQPGQIEFGSGFSSRRMTALFGSSTASGTVISPANGQVNVPLFWRNREVPNPLRMHGNEKVLGYPIVLTHFGNGASKLTVRTATLVTEDGTPVETYLNTKDNDEHLSNAAVLFPKTPLQPSTRYRVQFQGSDSSGSEVRLSSSFVTASASVLSR